MTRLSPRRFGAALLLGSFTLSPAGAQQFVHSPGLLPGPAHWTEGLACVDVDGDGDLDLCFAEGEGFATAGTKRQNVLLINQLVETGSLAFLDESVARLGQHLSNAKDVIAADVDGDGWVDLLYLNAFNIDTPFLYINQGPAQPGFFTLESAARGLTDIINAATAQFGDLDDDGDLDVIFNDSGPSFLGARGASRACTSTTAPGTSPRTPPRSGHPPRSGTWTCSSRTSTGIGTWTSWGSIAAPMAA
ncbi:MAG: FG-GAP-like repeat-containing protein [Longimicrobiales bacterium]